MDAYLKTITDKLADAVLTPLVTEFKANLQAYAQMPTEQIVADLRNKIRLPSTPNIGGGPVASIASMAPPLPGLTVNGPPVAKPKPKGGRAAAAQQQWLDVESFRQAFQRPDVAICAYAPCRGAYNGKVCGGVALNPQSDPLERRCAACMTKKGVIGKLLGGAVTGSYPGRAAAGYNYPVASSQPPAPGIPSILTNPLPSQGASGYPPPHSMNSFLPGGVSGLPKLPPMLDPQQNRPASQGVLPSLPQNLPQLPQLPHLQALPQPASLPAPQSSLPQLPPLQGLPQPAPQGPPSSNKPQLPPLQGPSVPMIPSLPQLPPLQGLPQPAPQGPPSSNKPQLPQLPPLQGLSVPAPQGPPSSNKPQLPPLQGLPQPAPQGPSVPMIPSLPQPALQGPPSSNKPSLPQLPPLQGLPQPAPQGPSVPMMPSLSALMPPIPPVSSGGPLTMSLPTLLPSTKPASEEPAAILPEPGSNGFFSHPQQPEAFFPEDKNHRTILFNKEGDQMIAKGKVTGFVPSPEEELPTDWDKALQPLDAAEIEWVKSVGAQTS